MAIRVFRKDHPALVEVFSQSRLIRAMARLWARVLGHSHLVGDIHVVSVSISVGRRIFNIGGG